jgi:hypothetical protein
MSRLVVISLAVLSVLWPALPAWAAFEFTWPDARSAAMLSPPHGPPVAFPRSSADTTPGAPSSWRFTASGGELYGLREAAGWGARATWGTGEIRVRGLVSSLGATLYQERTLSLGVDLATTGGITVSVGVRGLGLAASGLDDMWTAAVDAGVSRRFSGRVVVGASCSNLTNSRIGDSPAAARSTLAAALELPSVTLGGAVTLEDTFRPAPVFTFEADMTTWLRVRGGAGVDPGRLGVGIGLGDSRASWPLADIAFQWHPRLGVSSFASLTVVP